MSAERERPHQEAGPSMKHKVKLSLELEAQAELHDARVVRAIQKEGRADTVVTAETSNSACTRS